MRAGFPYSSDRAHDNLTAVDQLLETLLLTTEATSDGRPPKYCRKYRCLSSFRSWYDSCSIARFSSLRLVLDSFLSTEKEPLKSERVQNDSQARAYRCKAFSSFRTSATSFALSVSPSRASTECPSTEGSSLAG
jgi:hypothetical protein